MGFSCGDRRDPDLIKCWYDNQIDRTKTEWQEGGQEDRLQRNPNWVYTVGPAA